MTRSDNSIPFISTARLIKNYYFSVLTKKNSLCGFCLVPPEEGGDEEMEGDSDNEELQSNSEHEEGDL